GSAADQPGEGVLMARPCGRCQSPTWKKNWGGNCHSQEFGPPALLWPERGDEDEVRASVLLHLAECAIDQDPRRVCICPGWRPVVLKSVCPQGFGVGPPAVEEGGLRGRSGGE